MCLNNTNSQDIVSLLRRAASYLSFIDDNPNFSDLRSYHCFRFDKDASQWKERGLGDISVMWNKREGKGRVLMRREQILKLCCNHLITAEMELKPHQGKTSRLLMSGALKHPLR